MNPPNPPKANGQRMRDCIIGVPFPPSRKAELMRVAKPRDKSVAAFCRRLILEELDRVKAELDAGG